MSDKAPEIPDGAAPVKTPFFNQMAAALESARTKAISDTTVAKPIPEPPKQPPAPPAPTPAPAPPPPSPPPAPPPPKPQPPLSPPKPVDPDAEPENWNSPNFRPSRDDWMNLREKSKAFKTEKAEFQKRMAEMEAKLAEVAKAPAVPSPAAAPSEDVTKLKSTLEETTKKLQSYEQQLQTVALERSPEFNSRFDRRIKAAREMAENSVPAEAKEALETILAAPPTRHRKELLNELFTELDDADKVAVVTAVAEIDRTRKEREEELKNAAENYKRLEELELRKRAEDQKTQSLKLDEVASQVITVARQKFPAFQPVAGNPDQNRSVAEAEETVKRFLRGEVDPSEMLMLPAIAVEFNRLAQAYDTASRELTETKAALAQLQGASASVSGASSGSASPAPAKSWKEQVLEKWTGKKST